VTFYHRKPQDANFSIERLFCDIRKFMPEGIVCHKYEARFPSIGIYRRLYNVFEAAFRQRDINHITGDVHYLSFFLNKKKTILTIHDCASLERLNGLRRAIFFFCWFWLPEKRVSLITVISESTKKELLRHLKCKPDKIKVVYDCISDTFSPSPRLFNSDKPVILQIGTGNNKNLVNVAKALKGVNCHLRIIGNLSKAQVASLKDSGVDYSNVSGISNADVVEEYKNCDLLVFASTYEGFGLPILEANATGRPVVTSNLYSMPEVAGKSACLVDPYSVASIRDGIVKIINDREYRDGLVVAGFENVKRFRPDAIANDYAVLYEQVLQNS
jgi:glycosyltransferase involved in cell wall biosynthesis